MLKGYVPTDPVFLPGQSGAKTVKELLASGIAAGAFRLHWWRNAVFNTDPARGCAPNGVVDDNYQPACGAAVKNQPADPRRAAVRSVISCSWTGH
jgi:hypothetical protein